MSGDERRLIVTGDDFGFSPAVNEGILKAYREGILRFASLMVTGRAVEDAARLARENPGLGVGLHLDLCSANPVYWGLRYYFSAKDRARLEAEITRQIEACLRLGIKPTHADGHINIHTHPSIFPILARLAKRYGIARLRLARGELALSWRYSKRRFLPQLLLGATFSALASRLAPQAAGLCVPERSLGLLRSGLMSEEYVLSLLGNLPAGLTEIYFHPSSDPGSAAGARPTPSHQSISELETLTSPRIRAALQREGIRLLSASDLAHA